ncbi:DUF3667 domain-containing protein [Microbulbifer mangrovi]|uniref:DUF3667 domain-containing protein n=1 Tax=Microbulbifer mangrovi TaxID=927787 RepID=UPI001EFBD9C6|nr:DUF3667 domain-containing protein [Microbulbifer mangrovi]
MPELIGDFFSTVFGLDSRIKRTLWPLLLKPGFLTNEYLAGRRIRYVSPVRLFIFLCLTAFFVAQLSSDWRLDIDAPANNPLQARVDFNSVEQDILQATSVEEVLRLRDQAFEELLAAADESAEVPGIHGIMIGMEHMIGAAARQRIASLDPTYVLEEEKRTEQQSGLEPIQIENAPEAVNAWLAQQSAALNHNMQRIQKDPNLLKDALFGAIPSTLFLLLPVFALLLSLAYLFKKRLYMEHLIVALHSHAFLSLSLLLLVLLIDLRDWLTLPGAFTHTLFNLALATLGTWMPVYLLLTQKRVYQQGWMATSVKFFFLGTCYLALISIAAAFTVVTSMLRI